MSASPGHLKHIYDVPFERPRSVFSVRSDPAFHTMSEEIWSALDLARNSGGARSSGESKQVLQ
jgi:ABC-type nitrate/sulfonate/bicarbonate transport system ATPase subunit